MKGLFCALLAFAAATAFSSLCFAGDPIVRNSSFQVVGVYTVKIDTVHESQRNLPWVYYAEDDGGYWNEVTKQMARDLRGQTDLCITKEGSWMDLFYRNNGLVDDDRNFGHTYDHHKGFIPKDAADLARHLAWLDARDQKRYEMQLSNAMKRQDMAIAHVTSFGDSGRFNTPKPPTVSGGMVWVNGYTRRDGTHVKGHWKTAPDGILSNNRSYGN